MDVDKLRRRLHRAQLVLGTVEETVPTFLATYKPPPIAFVSIDLDLYSSTVQALRLTLDEIAGMAKAPVPAAELDEAKTYLNGAFPLEIESADEVATRVLTALGYGLGREFLDSYRDRISAVTAAAIQRFAGTRIHPERSVVVLVGNAAAFGPELAKELGPFATIPAAELDPLAPDLRRPAAPAPAPRPGSGRGPGG